MKSRKELDLIVEKESEHDLDSSARNIDNCKFNDENTHNNINDDTISNVDNLSYDNVKQKSYDIKIIYGLSENTNLNKLFSEFKIESRVQKSILENSNVLIYDTSLN